MGGEAGGGGGRCGGCGGELRPSLEAVSLALPRSGVSASARLPGRRCRSCNAARVDEGARERFQLAFSCALADAGVRTGEALRAMRNALRLRAADLAELLDVTPETISHWETGKARPSRAAFVTVGALAQDALDGRTTTRDRLAVLAGERAWPRTLSVKVREGSEP